MIDNKTNKTSVMSKILGAGLAGFLELCIFHPVDTISKRLMNNTSTGSFTQIIFPKMEEKPLTSKMTSLFPGIGFGFAYKITQRVYKFGGQPIVNDYLVHHHADTFRRAFGTNAAPIMIQAFSGAALGCGEIALLPLDVLKIRMQVSKDQFSNRGVAGVIRDEGFLSLYRGAEWTAPRNFCGSFALFGASAFFKKNVLKLKDGERASIVQDTASSVVGSFSSLLVSSPFDVIKTRIQARSCQSRESGRQILTSLLKNEGAGALFKGLVPKLLVVGPKLAFSFTVAQQMIAYFDRKF